MGGSLGNDDMGFRLRIKGIAVQAPVVKTFIVRGTGFAIPIPREIEPEIKNVISIDEQITSLLNNLEKQTTIGTESMPSVILANEPTVTESTFRALASDYETIENPNDISRIEPIKLRASMALVVKVYPLTLTPTVNDAEHATANKLVVPRGKITINGMEYLIENDCK
jgi:hypothetical protein